ncbi:MAG: hypothetical protein COB62_07215 [Piscirickettsiaceae bacterium]|nr:MAG: hypothetical protein COB62_07215 [Piscirickettsiaceae bacterium]
MINNIEELMVSAKKLAVLNKSQLEKAALAQQEAVKESVALAEVRMKAATNIKDVSSFNDFILEQMEFAQSGVEKMMADSKALFDGAKTYNEEVIKLVQEGNNSMLNDVTETVKKLPKKVA